MAIHNGKNAIANLTGSLAVPLIGLVMTPFYLRQIGLEGLGLVGLMTMITSVLGIFIAGASKTVQRDISHAFAASPADLNGLALGGLALFGLIGAALATTVFVFGYSKLSHFTSGTSISPDVLRRSVILISLVLGFGIVNGYIGSILMALKDQIVPSTLGVGVAVSVATACWFALNKYPRVDIFYLCQVIGLLCSTLFLGLRCRSTIRRNSPPGRKTGMIKAWKARAGVSGRLSLVLIVHEGLGVLITQIDRVLITYLFPLKALGAYNLGANPARMTGIFANPVNSATFPEMCSMVGRGESKEMIGEYLGRLIYLMTILLSCAFIILLPSANTMLTLWLGEGKVPSGATECFIILATGHLLLGIAGPPYNLTVAFQRAGYGVPQNVIAILVLPVIGYFAAKAWGIPGAALVWLIYCASAVILCTVIAYRRHASFKQGLPWLRACGICIFFAVIISLALKISDLSPFVKLIISIFASILLLLTNAVTSFGWSPKSWASVLEPKSLEG